MASSYIPEHNLAQLAASTQEELTSELVQKCKLTLFHKNTHNVYFPLPVPIFTKIFTFNA